MAGRTIWPFLALFLSAALSNHSLASDRIMISSGEWPPYLSEDYPESGFAAQIIQEAFQYQGITVEYVFLPWSRALASVKTSRIQASAFWSCTAERAKDYLYSSPILPYQYVFYHRSSMEFDWHSLADLQGLNVGLTQDYSYGETLAEAMKNDVIFGDVTTSDLSNFRKLLRGRIDLFPIDPVVGEAIVNQNFRSSADQLTFHPRPLRQAYYHLVFDKSSDQAPELIRRFNKGLEALKESGRYEEIISSALAQFSKPVTALILREKLVNGGSGSENGACSGE